MRTETGLKPLSGKWLKSTNGQFQMVDEPKVDRDPAVNRSYSRGRCGRLPHISMEGCAK
jgi:hypothetical protein